MAILWAGAFVVALFLCIFLMQKISKQSSRINQLDIEIEDGVDVLLSYLF